MERRGGLPKAWVSLLVGVSAALGAWFTHDEGASGARLVVAAAVAAAVTTIGMLVLGGLVGVLDERVRTTTAFAFAGGGPLTAAWLLGDGRAARTVVAVALVSAVMLVAVVGVCAVSLRERARQGRAVEREPSFVLCGGCGMAVAVHKRCRYCGAAPTRVA